MTESLRLSYRTTRDYKNPSIQSISIYRPCLKQRVRMPKEKGKGILIHSRS